MSGTRMIGIFIATLLTLPVTTLAAEKLSVAQLVELGKTNDDKLRNAIVTNFDVKELKEGTAWKAQGSEVFFATEGISKPSLFIDGKSGPEMQNVAGATLWFAIARLEPVGRLHSFYYVTSGLHDWEKGGVKFGGRLDVPAFSPMMYRQENVPAGKLSEKIVHTSKIYDGMMNNYWIYVPAQYDTKQAAALMVFQDGEWYLDRDGRLPLLNAIDALIEQKKIPVMICVFINPGDISGAPTFNLVKKYSEEWHRDLKDSMRSTLYDTVSDRYPRYLRDEILADVQTKYNIRKDAYSRAIMGASSGAICAFNAAWQMPEQFSRVISWIGTFTSLQWKEDSASADGGQDYPDRVLREPHRNIRVWLQDGSEDMELATYGSWPLNNIRMANALKLKDYDFHFSFGKGTHNQAQGAAEFPEEMAWLWRGYDAARTDEKFEMETSEKGKPLFRVAVTNRDADAGPAN